LGTQVPKKKVFAANQIAERRKRSQRGGTTTLGGKRKKRNGTAGASNCLFQSGRKKRFDTWEKKQREGTTEHLCVREKPRNSTGPKAKQKRTCRLERGGIFQKTGLRLRATMRHVGRFPKGEEENGVIGAVSGASFGGAPQVWQGPPAHRGEKKNKRN